MVLASSPPAAEAVTLAEVQQPTRLRITNGCGSEPLWIAYMGQQMLDPQNTKLRPHQSYDFTVPDGLKSTRYWAKTRCDADGKNCAVGDSGGPGQACDPKLGCAPPLDTKFEGSFGVTGLPCNTSADEYKGCDFVDVSLVDGFSLPFKFKVMGDCSARFSSPVDVRNVSKEIDCSELSMDDCPTDEDLGPAGSGVNLRVFNPYTKSAVGCNSPCGALTYANWGNKHALGHAPQDAQVHPYCCPTPPETVKSCRSGPVVNTTYVQSMHKKCPVYAFAYDDEIGLMHCPAGTKYEVVFYCPTAPGSSHSP